MFDKKYKTIITFKYSPGYTEMLDWVNNNSMGSVDIKVGRVTETTVETLYIGFEREDDATFFKIKYAVD